MIVTNFIEHANYEIVELYDNSGYRIIMNTDTHDIWFIYQEGAITRYEAYNILDDSSVFLTEVEIKQFENWTKNKL